MNGDELWRNSYMMSVLARLGGVAIFFLGIAIAFTDLLRPGGWPAIGAALAIMGAIEALLVSRLLKKHWDQERE